jgi:hypothetical protein
MASFDRAEHDDESEPSTNKSATRRRRSSSPLDAKIARGLRSK